MLLDKDRAELYLETTKACCWDSSLYIIIPFCAIQDFYLSPLSLLSKTKKIQVLALFIYLFMLFSYYLIRNIYYLLLSFPII